ncbi:MAG: tRNA dihydrouridine synthase DusB [Verrucomicrobiota bacterium]|jgi:tRNA-dihydrouridine synthase B
MAGVTDVVFRQLCKELGADVMVTEFVSAEGIMQRDEYTRKYTEFTEEQRPVGIQLFGADGPRMGEAARKILDWKQPDFIDINFGCPVNKVVSKNGGSSLLKDCPVLASVASGVVKAMDGTGVPVTAKIRIGWDQQSINAVEVCHILEDCGIQAIAVHGRTRAQGYSGLADWDVIDACARSVKIPVIGNGDLQRADDVIKRRRDTAISGVMIGRAAMQHPWIFRETKARLHGNEEAHEVTPEERWALILRHCRLAVRSQRYGNERHAMMAMRGRLLAYCKGFAGAKELRQLLAKVESVTQVEDIAAIGLARELAGEEEPSNSDQTISIS